MGISQWLELKYTCDAAKNFKLTHKLKPRVRF